MKINFSLLSFALVLVSKVILAADSSPLIQESWDNAPAMKKVFHRPDRSKTRSGP